MKTLPPKNNNYATAAKPSLGHKAARQQSLLPLAGSGRGLWKANSTKTMRKLRDEWNR
jgi:hypothetical protein